MSVPPPLVPLHAESMLSSTKLAVFDKLSTEAIKQSLLPGSDHSLKCRPDGTMLDGHHRISVLKSRGEEVNALPREILSTSVQAIEGPRDF